MTLTDDGWEGETEWAYKFVSQSSHLMTTDFVRVFFLTEIQNFMQSTKYVWHGISGSRAQEFSSLSNVSRSSLILSL